MLADALGATDGITILYYQDSVSYKYRGKLRAQNILASFSAVPSVSPKDLPLRRLNSPEDLKIFPESADKVVLLLEFCGRAPTMLTKTEQDATAYGFDIQASVKGGGLAKSTQGANQTIKSRANKIEKMTQNERLKCGIEHWFCGVPWLKEFSSANDSAVLEDHHERLDSGLSCSDQEFQHFESFFSKFIAGFQRTRRYEKSSADAWSTNYRGIRFLLTLGGNDWDLDIPADKPSVVLFVDRFSESAKIRRSEEPLQAFRELALHTQIAGQNNSSQEIFSVQDYGSLESKSGYVGTALIKISSLKEVSTHLLEQKNEAKLSLLAKEAGFQLLSQDFDVANTLASQPEVASNIVSMDLTIEGAIGHTDDFDRVRSLETGMPLTAKKNFDSTDGEYASDDRKIITTSRSSTQSVSTGRDKYHKDDKLDMLDDVNVAENVLSRSSQADFLYGFVNGSIPPYQRSVSVVQSPREPVHPPFVNLDFHEVDGIPCVSSSIFSEMVFGYSDADNDIEKVGHHWQKDILVLSTTNWCEF
ncbi:hypothetical protein RJ641_009725 [Dillenia turbinata]|uniref:Uncharacterized protein n=1 Tax=Dillenia turbinata TaxID=194707 RepID=A0AAN8V5T7_9MAGN